MNVYTLKDFIRNEDKNSALKLQILKRKWEKIYFMIGHVQWRLKNAAIQRAKVGTLKSLQEKGVGWK